jgi:hypothetical protein
MGVDILINDELIDQPYNALKVKILKKCQELSHNKK